MWKATTSLVQPGVSKLSIRPESDDEPLTFRAFFQLCRGHPAFADFVSEKLTATNYQGFFWELPAITADNIDSPFECVVVEGLSLVNLTADPGPFANQFAKAAPEESVIVFKNLSGDATLVSPVPLDGCVEFYPHFATFLREAPAAQISAFWKALGTTALDQVSATPFWLSTAGLGVSWLHLRFDSRPKYYRFARIKRVKKYLLRID